MTGPSLPDPQTSSIVRLQYGDRLIESVRGARLLDVILTAGIDHHHICGGHGFCTSCRVEVLSGSDHLSPVSPLERERLGKDAGRMRLACQTTVEGDASVCVPRPVRGRFSLDDD